MVTPLLAQDARNLERSLQALNIDAAWISRSAILNAWKDRADGGGAGGPLRSYSEAELRTAFDAIDTDSSGDIDLEELRVAITAIYPEAGDEVVQTMIELGDVDGDKEVSFYEFKKIITL